MKVSAVTGNAVLKSLPRRTSIQKPKVRSRQPTANQMRPDCATIAIQARVVVGFGRRMAADLKSSWAALSETTRPNQSSASERFVLEFGEVNIRTSPWNEWRWRSS